jgi:hypothetical protein
MYCND